MVCADKYPAINLHSILIILIIPFMWLKIVFKKTQDKIKFYHYEML